MTGPTLKPAVTAAEYKAAAEDLRKAADRASAALKEAHAAGDVEKGKEITEQLQSAFKNFSAFREGLPRDVLLSIHADRILERFSIEEERGWKAWIGSIIGREPMRAVCLVIPPDISDEDAMHALNARFREMFPDKDRAAINERLIQSILDAGNGSGLRSRGPRLIRLIGVVPGTTEVTRDQQAEVLQQRGLMFSHPIEQALAAAAYACKRSGEDLFKDLAVRGSVPEFFLYTSRDDGVYIQWYYGQDDSFIAASGSPSSPLR